MSEAAKKPKHGKSVQDALYLRYARAESYGALRDVTLGPLQPGLNIVHGENEAGKSTFASLIGGIMFGWEDGRSARNTYKPTNAERSGTLAFSRETSDAVYQRLARARNADGLQGDGDLLRDIDKETYAEMFNLNSDQLRGMGDASRVTSKLLTAGAGTPVPPSEVRATIDARIAEYTSRSAKYPHSIVQLTERRDELAKEEAAALSASEELLADDSSLKRLKARRNRLQAQLYDLNAEVERLTAALANVEQLENREAELRKERRSLEKSTDDVDWGGYADVPTRLLSISPEEEQSLRERLDRLDAEVKSTESQLESAFERYEEACEDYEQAVVDKGFDEERGKTADAKDRKAGVRVAASGAAAAVCAVAGALIVVFQWVFGNGSDAIAAMLVSALFFVAAGICAAIAAASFVSSRATRTSAPNTDEALDSAQWLMKKEKARYAEAQQAHATACRAARTQLEVMGLSQAQGSIEAARVILDQSAIARAHAKEINRFRRDGATRIDEISAEIERTIRERQRAIDVDGRGIQDVYALREEIERASEQRDAQSANLQGVSFQIGQIEQRLGAARGRNDLEKIRLERAQVQTRLGESQKALARLLLARRLLDRAIETWETESQPEVYRRAGELLSDMTDGRWRRIMVDDQGKVSVADETGGLRSTLLLSTGTAQQVYLSLRLALLESAEFVGRNVPVVCDDMLVHFDERRRRAAARSLVRLSRKRQVIVFTCHTDIVDLLREMDPECAVIEL